jgi:ATP-binding cassette subfamily B (MDR/TAP) protein 1
MKHILRQNIAYFDSAEAASVSVQATTNSNNVNTGISEKLTLSISAISTFVAAFVVAFSVQWKLTLITICIVPSVLMVIAICIGADMKREKEILSVYSKASLLAEEVFSSMRTVHAFWLHPMLSTKYDAYLADAQKLGMKKSPIYSFMFSVEFFCTFAGYGLAFWQGIRMYARGEIQNSGDVVTVIFAVIVASTAMMLLAPQILALTKAASAAEELFKTIDRVSEIDAISEEGQQPQECIGDIEISGIHFAYPSRPTVKVLQGLDLHIPANKTTALVGASGSGKSTVVGLLERWYEYDQGQIRLDGVELNKLNVGWLRTNIRLVQQEPALFKGTVYANVAFGLVGTIGVAELTEEQRLELVKGACQAAYAHEFIESLSHGYDTQVGERATMLSGGQKQRIAIARSIISNPRLLLLDEATSALDPQAESIVQKALDNVSAQRTTLVIAHKLSTVRSADNIAVMSKGVIVEQGSHAALIAANGAYARLVRAQDLGNADTKWVDRDVKATDDRPSLAQVATEVASNHTKPDVGKSGETTLNYGLLKCLWILLPEQKELWLTFLLLIIAGALAGLTYPAQAIVFSRTMTAFQLEAPDIVKQGDFWSLMFFVIAVGNFLVYAVIGWNCNIVAQSASRKYRLELFNNTLKQDMEFFDKDDNGTGAIASRLSSYPNNLLELLGFNLMLIFINVVNVVSSSTLAIIYGWKLGLVVVFGALPPLLFSGYLRIRLEVRLEEATSKRFSNSASLAAEAVSAIRTVASLTLEKHILENYEACLHNVATESVASLFSTMFWYSLTQSISFLAMALGFWYGGQLISTGEYSTSQFFVVFIGVIFSGEAAAAFFSYTTSITKAYGAANYILWFRTQIPSIREHPSQDRGQGEKHEDHNGSSSSSKDPAYLAISDVSFSYPSRPSNSVLKDVNVDVAPGQFLAFVGPSGCGKTTMIALLERFYDPISGTIRFDNALVTELCPRRYRQNVALVQQEPTLYHSSLRDNIAMGLASDTGAAAVTDGQIEEACRQANILDFVRSLPEGLGTLCGSRGTQLSGGQRQRVAIARAIIRKPRLLLLDEATSALDTESERTVQDALEKAKCGRTTVAVAHRLSTIKDADCIFVFGNGQIIERGSHQELLAKGAVYYEMCLGQGLDQVA